MEFQTDKYSCGVYALRNALLALGHAVSAACIRKHTATVAAFGTQEHGIKQALERLGYNWEEISSSTLQEAVTRVAAALDGRSAAILLTHAGQHWRAAIGKNGNALVVFDSNTTKGNRQVNGIHIWTPEKAGWTAYKGLFYALIVKKP